MKDTKVLVDNGIMVEQALDILGDMEMYEETLNDFLEESKERLSKIEEYKNSLDMPNYAILVHAMKSDSKYLGFTHLAELSFQHEMESKAGNTNYIQEHYEELMIEANRIINIVKSYLNQ